MSVWDVFGNVGGIQQTFLVFSSFLIVQYSQMSFLIETLNDLYDIKTSDTNLKNFKTDKLNVTFCQKLRLIINFCPNRKMKRLIKKGEHKLNKELDLLNLIKQHKHHHQHVKEVASHRCFENEFIDIDTSGSSSSSGTMSPRE